MRVVFIFLLLLVSLLSEASRVVSGFGARNLEMIAGGMEVPGILTVAAGKAVMSPWSDAVAAFGGYDAYTGEEASRLQGASMLAVGLLSGPLDDVVKGARALRYVDNAAESAALGGRSVLAANTTRAIRPYFPANNGFLGATEKQFLMPGQTIDRFGGSGYSRFFSPAGTSEAARALPANSAGLQLRSFEVMKPFPVDAGTVAPAFGQPGLGQQFVTPVRLETLLKRGILRESP